MPQFIDFIQLASTIHTYSGGNQGSGNESVDGNLDTFYRAVGGDFATGSGGSFASTATLISEHEFAAPMTVKELKYKIHGGSQSNSPTDNACRLQVNLQYQLQGSSTWVDFTGGGFSYNSSNTTVSFVFNDTFQTITQTILNVKKVRALVSNSGSFHNSFGNHTWDLVIWELQAFGEGPAGFAVII